MVNADTLNNPINGLGYVVTFNSYNEYRFQIAIAYVSSLDLYVRTRQDNGWTAWKKLPTRAEMDAVSSKWDITEVDTNINGLYAFKIGPIVWLRIYDCPYNVSGTVPSLIKPRKLIHACAISSDNDRKVAQFSINPNGEIVVISQITSGYIYGEAIYFV